MPTATPQITQRTTARTSGPTIADVGWLVAAMALLLVADGRATMPLATWLAPACLLRFVRTQPRLRGGAIAYAVLVVARGVSYYGMIPIPGIFYYIFLVISGVSSVMPFIADRLLARRLGPLAGTFVLPTVMVTMQYIYAHGPVGSWGSIAYAQSGHLALMQLLSVTGLWGIVFLIGWFAACINNALESWLSSGTPISRHSLGPLALFLAVLLAVLLLGQARLALLAPSSPTVRVASFSPAKNGAGPMSDGLLDEMIAGDPTAAANFSTATRATQDELLARTEREARAGAKIVFWSETAAYVLKSDEPALFARGSALASKYHIYLGMALGTWTPKVPLPLENKLVMVAPDGHIAWQYWKARPTPGPETAMSVRSDGKLRQLDTPYGRLTAAICYDTDFAQLLAQAGAMRSDILLSPAGDWRAIDPRHTEIASFRAIEQGANLVRQANQGFSAAYDYEGRRLAQMDHYQASDLTMVAQVPTRGVRTVYSALGDWFAYLCIAGLLALIVVAIRSSAVPVM